MHVSVNGGIGRVSRCYARPRTPSSGHIGMTGNGKLGWFSAGRLSYHDGLNRTFGLWRQRNRTARLSFG